MNNFVFHKPTKIIFGREILSQLGKEVSAYGKKVFMAPIRRK